MALAGEAFLTALGLAVAGFFINTFMAFEVFGAALGSTFGVAFGRFLALAFALPLAAVLAAGFFRREGPQMEGRHHVLTSSFQPSQAQTSRELHQP